MNSNSILPYIDYEAFKRNPKIIIGYSDVTAILLAIYAQTAITTYYGPALVASFGELLPFVDYTYKYFKEVTMDNTKIPYVFEKPEYWTDEYINWETQDRSKEKRADCCHTHPMLTLHIGCEIELNSTEKKISIIKYNRP
jgi:muramoyltetrapeptide carboxypeptidase LdcA involved in peptidoglycan recycling